MKNKTVLIVGLIAVLVVGGFGVWKFVLSSKKNVVVEEEEQIELPPVDESVEVEFEIRSDGKGAILRISNIPKGTESIEYEIKYDTDKGLPKGSLGKIRLKSGETSIEREIDFGTCSRNVCRYDNIVGAVELVLKFNSPEGSSIFQETYEL